MEDDSWQKVSESNLRYQRSGTYNKHSVRKVVFLSDLELTLLFPASVLQSHLTPIEEILSPFFSLKKKGKWA